MYLRMKELYHSPIAMFIWAIGGILCGIMFLLLALFAKYREDNEPFQDNY